MSDLEPKSPKTQDNSPAVGVTANQIRRMTVWYDDGTNTFRYSLNNGDLEIVRYPGDPAEFPIHFQRGSDETWEFINWASSPKTNAPVFTPEGQLVLELDNVQPAIITVTDLVEYEALCTYKYSLAIKLSNGMIKTADPEIQNRRHLTAVRPTIEH